MVIYLTTHITTGKMYVGRDKNNNPSYFGSGTDIKQIIKNEGKGNLKKTILSECFNESELLSQEEYWLNYFDAENNPKFYNRTNKAYGCSRQTEEGKRKISENRKSFEWTPESKLKASKTRTGMKVGSYKTRKDKGKPRGKLPSTSNALKERDRSYSYKPVIQYDLEGNAIREYKSAQEAKIQTQLKIQNNLIGLAKSCGGFIWKYRE